jgi:outer membrane protein TolC
MLAERERTVAGEVRQAAHDLNAHRRLAEIARRQAASWKAKVEDLENRGAKGLASFAEIASARLEWLKARGDVVAESVAVHVAEVKIRQAQSAWGHDGCATVDPAPPAPVLLPDVADAPDAPDPLRLPDLVVPAPSPASK